MHRSHGGRGEVVGGGGGRGGLQPFSNVTVGLFAFIFLHFYLLAPVLSFLCVLL